MKLRIFNNLFVFTNFTEFFSIYKDVFILKQYKFLTRTKNPFIIDCGSHIGIATIFFKNIYPKSNVLCFEPNPRTFELLRNNIAQNSLKKVKPINAIISEKRGLHDFYVNLSNWSWGDSAVKNSWYEKKNYKKIKIKSLTLSKFINKKVDLLKIDIEGLETLVLFEIEKKLKHVDRIFLEFHADRKNQKNNLRDLLLILERNGFTYKLDYPFSFLNPFKKFKLENIPKSNFFLIIKAYKKNVCSC